MWERSVGLGAGSRVVMAGVRVRESEKWGLATVFGEMKVSLMRVFEMHVLPKKLCFSWWYLN